MAAKKYLGYNATTGRAAQVQATDASAGVANAGDLVALGAAGRLDQSMMPIGVGPETATLVAGETLSAGQFVWVNSADGKAYKADRSNGREADGYTILGAAAAANVVVYFESINDAVTGLTPGKTQYLSTAGGTTETPPTTAGLVQTLGKALSSTAMSVELGDPIELI